MIRVVAKVLTLRCHVSLNHLVHIDVLQGRCRSCDIENHLDHSFRLGSQFQTILNDYRDWLVDINREDRLLTVERLLTILIWWTPLETPEVISYKTEFANAKHDLMTMY